MIAINIVTIYRLGAPMIAYNSFFASGASRAYFVQYAPQGGTVELGYQFLRQICGPCTCHARINMPRASRKPRSGFTVLVFSGPHFGRLFRRSAQGGRRCSCNGGNLYDDAFNHSIKTVLADIGSKWGKATQAYKACNLCAWVGHRKGVQILRMYLTDQRSENFEYLWRSYFLDGSIYLLIWPQLCEIDTSLPISPFFLSSSTSTYNVSTIIWAEKWT